MRKQARGHLMGEANLLSNQRRAGIFNICR
jgi:hypothetical protein